MVALVRDHGMDSPAPTRRLAGFVALSAAVAVLATLPAPAAADIAFGKGTLAGETSDFPTSLQWGPDGRLYVGQVDGRIKVYTVQRSGPNNYAVTQTETIDQVDAIPNHDDDGSLQPAQDTRLLTGLLVTGTAADPVVYVTSSDPRVGAGPGGSDLNLDTNSSIVSRLTRSGSTWNRVDLVRGLPRSEENHAANGLALDSATNTLYVAQGGNTNEGAPSNNFALLPEYAYSAAILSIDLDAIGNTTYDLPTLTDDDPAINGRDPFGGDDGRNQARITALSPVQVYMPGFRNPYDLVRTLDGHMFTIDNGGNTGWGAPPVNAGPGGTCTNDPPVPTGADADDSLHLVTAGAYGGHPNPTRANRANTFNSGANAQSPVPVGNPIECDYRPPGSPASDALASFPGSTNGIAEYTGSAFGGAMQGDLIAAGYTGNKIFRVHRTASGSGVAFTRTLASNLGANPLDVAIVGDAGAFPGTIWIADQGDNHIYVLEPANLSSCVGDDDPADPTRDEDGDGFTNHDELANGTSPCSAADVPPDADHDFVSDLEDPDDDNDGIPDTQDPFAIDSHNGLATALPVVYPWENNAPSPGGLLHLGFTGLMTNGTVDYLTLFDTNQMTAGGAAGVLTLNQAGAGDAAAPANDQTQAFQFGVNPASAAGRPFEARTRIVDPFAGGAPTGRDSLGLFVGTGGQDDYVRVVAGARAGDVGMRVDREVGGTLTEGAVAPLALPLAGSGQKAIDLYLVVDPAASTVQAQYTVTTGAGTSARQDVGPPLAIPGSWLTDPARGLAVGIISTSRDATPFPATWDYMTVTPLGGPPGGPGGGPGGGAAPGGSGGATPPGGPPALAAAKLARGQRTLVVRDRGTTSVTIDCPRQRARRCRGRLELDTLYRYPRSQSAAARIRLAHRSFWVWSGRRARVTLTLTPAARRLLRGRRSVAARLTLRATGGARGTSTVTLRVRGPG